MDDVITLPFGSYKWVVTDRNKGCSCMQCAIYGTDNCWRVPCVEKDDFVNYHLERLDE